MKFYKYSSTNSKYSVILYFFFLNISLLYFNTKQMHKQTRQKHIHIYIYIHTHTSKYKRKEEESGRKTNKQSKNSHLHSIQFVSPSINLYLILFQIIVKNMPNFPKLIQFVFSEITYLLKSKVQGHSLQPLRNSTDRLILP